MVDAMDPIARKLLCETSPRRVADAAVRLAGDEVAAIEASLPSALRGDGEQVRLYVLAYGQLSERVLEAIHLSAPAAKAVLWGEAMNAPFTYWVGSLDSGRGTAVAMVSMLRQTLPGGRPLSPPSKRLLPAWGLDDTEVVRFYRAVSAAFDESEQSPLQRVRGLFALNRTDAAKLFGVRRQALEGWERNGVPADRQAKLATLGAIADLLSVQLKSDRLPAVARRQAPAYGGRSILEAVAAGDEEQVLDTLRSGFDWASAA